MNKVFKTQSYQIALAGLLLALCSCSLVRNSAVAAARNQELDSLSVGETSTHDYSLRNRELDRQTKAAALSDGHE